MSLTIEKTDIDGVLLLEQPSFKDNRGVFERLYCANEFGQSDVSLSGFTQAPKQINFSRNFKQGTFRGMHYQIPPKKEYKIVSCLSGEIMDFVLDVRDGSATFLQHLEFHLKESVNRSLLIPPGVAHGFQTLVDNTQVLYFHSDFFSDTHEAGVRYDDPRISFSLPLPVTEISERDTSHPLLDDNFVGVRI